MRLSSIRYGLVSAVLMSAAAPSFAAAALDEVAPVRIAQANPSADREPGEAHRQPPMAQGAGPRGADSAGPGPRDPGFDRAGPWTKRDHAGPPRPLSGLEIAARLSAAQTYVGITPDQDAAWRAYTSAVIGFFDRPRPEQPGPKGAKGGPVPPKQDEASKDAPRPRLLTERIAGHVLAQAEKAGTLKDAVDALRATLSEEQIARLREAERDLMPPPRGPRGQGWQDRAGRGPQGGPQRGPSPEDGPRTDAEPDRPAPPPAQ